LTIHCRADAHFTRYGETADQFVLLDLLAWESEVRRIPSVMTRRGDCPATDQTAATSEMP
jgi:hypothetical protein